VTAFEQPYFENAYHDYAAQNPRRKLAFYARTIERHAGGSRPIDLLDLGCGLGRFVGFLAERGGYRLHATDLSHFAVEQNRKRHPGVDFRVAPATDRPYPDHSVDVITAMDVIEHVPDVAAVGDAIWAQLRPGGLFVFVVPVYDGLSGPVIRRLDHDPTHVHKQPRSFWIAWASEQFEVLEWRGILRYLLFGRFYLHWPTRWARNHTPAIIVVARRRATR